MARGFGAAEASFGRGRIRPSEIERIIKTSKPMSVAEAEAGGGPLAEYIRSEDFKRDWEEHLGDLDAALSDAASDHTDGDVSYTPDSMFVEKGGVVWEISHGEMYGHVTVDDPGYFGRPDLSYPPEFEWEVDEAPKDFEDSVNNWTRIEAVGTPKDFVREGGRLVFPTNSSEFKNIMEMFGKFPVFQNRKKLNELVQEVKKLEFDPAEKTRFNPTGLSYGLSPEAKEKALDRMKNGIVVDARGRTREEFEQFKANRIEKINATYQKGVDFAKKYPRFVKGFKD